MAEKKFLNEGGLRHLIGKIKAYDAAALTLSQEYTDEKAAGKANVSHVHDISEVTDLQSTLDTMQGEIDANESHANSKANPHGVTAAQVDAYTKDEADAAINTAINNKAAFNSIYNSNGTEYKAGANGSLSFTGGNGISVSITSGKEADYDVNINASSLKTAIDTMQEEINANENDISLLDTKFSAINSISNDVIDSICGASIVAATYDAASEVTF